MTGLETDDADLPDDEAPPRSWTGSVLGRVIEGFFDLLELLSCLLH
jgi:hypothetical protein